MDSPACQSPPPTRLCASPQAPAYLPHCDVLLRGLGITQADLDGQAQVIVNTAYLRFLISRIAATAPVDEQWYAGNNPDVRGARLAGTIESYQKHFESHGYFEGRTPYAMPFDSSWYCESYADLRQYLDGNVGAAHRHFFEETGYREGRAGIEAHLEQAEAWRSGHP